MAGLESLKKPGKAAGDGDGAATVAWGAQHLGEALSFKVVCVGSPGGETELKGFPGGGHWEPSHANRKQTALGENRTSLECRFDMPALQMVFRRS